LARTKRIGDEKIEIKLGLDALIVLDDLLARWERSEDEMVIHLQNDGEWHALLKLHGAIEPFNPFTFAEEYSVEVRRAQQRLIDRGGTRVTQDRLVGDA
jgi:hypothetical protein